MTLVAALDTMAFAWALRDTTASVAQHDRQVQQQALDLFRWLDGEGAQIVIPAISAAELLTPLDQEAQQRMLQLLSRRCRAAVFDLRTAGIAASLYRQTADIKPQYAEATTPTRFFRADTLIVASAKAAGATHFFSHDKACRSIAARAGMIALGLEDDPNYPLLHKDDE